MDSLVSDDMFTLPLVLESSEINHPVGLCSGWQFEVTKDQSLPYVIFDNPELSFQNVQDFPLLLTDSGLNASDLLLSRLDYPVNNSDIPLLVEKAPESINEVSQSTNEACSEELSEPPPKVDGDFGLMDDLVETVVIYKCKLCQFKANDKSLLSSHLQNIHLKNVQPDDSSSSPVNSVIDDDMNEQSRTCGQDKMVYLCGNCNEAFPDFNKCRTHMVSVHNIFKCTKAVVRNDEQADVHHKTVIIEEYKLNGEKCLVNGNTVSEDKKAVVKERKPFKLERSAQNKNRTIRCPISLCMTKLTTRDQMEKHKACHVPENVRTFRCPHCKMTFARWNMCALHLWNQHSIDVDLFSCSGCDYKTATFVKLEVHARVHSDGKDFMCNECGKLFKQKTQLRNHQVLHLKFSDEERPKWIQRKECEQCKKTFADSKSLKKHVQAVHSKLRPYVCQVCGHCSATKDMLQRHLRQHTGEKPFSCPLCNYVTGDHNSLRRHRMRHTGVRPYSCQHCSYTAIQSCSLKNHIATKHPGKEGIYSCTQCSFSTVSQASYNQHVADHKTKPQQEIQPIITISIPKVDVGLTDDDESNQCYFEGEDTGGITIPADSSLEITSVSNSVMSIKIPKENINFFSDHNDLQSAVSF